MAHDYGHVYIFNLYSTAVTKFLLNGQGSAGAIAAPSEASNYTPAQIAQAVPRTNLHPDQLDEPMFVVGENEFTVDYDGDNWKGTIDIPNAGDTPLQNDLWMYLAYDTILFLNTDGKILHSVAMVKH